MIRAVAMAKVNFGLRVRARRQDGFHPIRGIFQSVDLADDLSLDTADADVIASSSGGPVIDETDNLAFRAVAAVRDIAESTQPFSLQLDKTIPVGSGLGGGSADAAAALAMAAQLYQVEAAELHRLAPQLGSDVPFCLIGGTAQVAGRGDEVQQIDPLDGFSLTVVVPPFEVATARVFAKWDELSHPTGLRLAGSELPPPLRAEEELVNDLFPATVALHPEIEDWRAELEARWGRRPMLSGSGPAFFGFFVDADEARGAAAAAPVGSRMAVACELSPVGWSLSDSENT